MTDDPTPDQPDTDERLALKNMARRELVIDTVEAAIKKDIDGYPFVIETLITVLKAAKDNPSIGPSEQFVLHHIGYRIGDVLFSDDEATYTGFEEELNAIGNATDWQTARAELMRELHIDDDPGTHE